MSSRSGCAQPTPRTCGAIPTLPQKNHVPFGVKQKQNGTTRMGFIPFPMTRTKVKLLFHNTIGSRKEKRGEAGCFAHRTKPLSHSIFPLLDGDSEKHVGCFVRRRLSNTLTDEVLGFALHCSPESEAASCSRTGSFGVRLRMSLG